MNLKNQKPVEMLTCINCFIMLSIEDICKYTGICPNCHIRTHWLGEPEII